VLLALWCTLTIARGTRSTIEVRVRVISVDTGYAYRSGRQKRTVTVRVALGNSPDETMRITVVVPEDGDEEVAREIGLARARDFARRFSDLLPFDAPKQKWRLPAA
jgi:hypothetical protein